MSIKITRTKPRSGRDEQPWKDSRGYQLADPKHGAERHKVENATFVQSLEKAAELIERGGFSIRMGREGKRPSLICPEGLRITR
jgi:hypothetical protein